MKTNRRSSRPIGVGMGAVATLLLLAGAACGSSADTGSAPTSSVLSASSASSASSAVTVDDNGVTPVPADQTQAALDGLPVGTLTQAERDGLLWMREEEKLALDVYQALHDRWQRPVFDNIAGAEATHTDSVKALLDRYGLADPAEGMAAGSFLDPQIQALYDDLVAQGSRSLVDALTVGATIEDLDIADLRARATETPDIALVYANLEKGSRNHLRAFTAQLDGQGAIYTPAYISQADYDAIVASGIERGRAG